MAVFVRVDGSVRRLGGHWHEDLRRFIQLKKDRSEHEREQRAPTESRSCWYWGVAPIRKPVFKSCEIVPHWKKHYTRFRQLFSAVI